MVYRSTLPQLRQSKEELDRQEAELSRLIEVRAEEALVARQVEKVESVRASLNKIRIADAAAHGAGPDAQAERQVQGSARAMEAGQPTPAPSR